MREGSKSFHKYDDFELYRQQLRFEKGFFVGIDQIQPDFFLLKLGMRGAGLVDFWLVQH